MAESSARAVDRALALLVLTCENGPISLSEAARLAALPVSTAARLLRTLEAAGFVVRGPDSGYGPGPRMVQLGATALSNQHLIGLAAPAMKQLSEQTGESAYLSVPGHGETALYISITEGTHSVRHVSWVGRTVPTERSAVGVVLRGETPEAGYVAVARGVEDDVTAIAAPINLGGRTIAGLSLLVPSYRASDQRVSALGCLLAQVAADLSNQILPTPSTMPSPTTHEPPPPTTAAPDPPDGEGPASPANSATPSSPHNLLALAGRVRARRGDRAGAR